MKNIILLLFFSIMACTCHRKPVDMRKKEQTQMQEQLAGSKVQVYTSMKIALRSTAVVGQNPELDSARKTMFALVGAVLHTGAAIADKQTPIKLNPLEVMTLVKEIYRTQNVLLKTNEDSLPTLLENIFYVFTGSSKVQSSYFPSAYDINQEHIILSLLWQTTPSAPKDFALYEVSKSDEKNIGDLRLRLVYELTKAFVLYENKYVYHSYDQCQAYLQDIESRKVQVCQTPFPNMARQTVEASEQCYYQLHGMGYIIRALDEEKMNMKKESLEDMGLFLKDMEKGGLDNELTWLVSAYLHISQEDYDKALPALEKLQKSQMINQPEKQAIDELIVYLKARKKDNALNVLHDKLAFGKIAFHVLLERLKMAQVLTDLDKSKEGKSLVAIQQDMNDHLQYFKSAKSSLLTDSLSAKAKGILKNVFH